MFIIYRIAYKKYLYNKFRKLFLDLSEYKKFVKENELLLETDKSDIIDELS